MTIHGQKQCQLIIFDMLCKAFKCSPAEIELLLQKIPLEHKKIEPIINDLCFAILIKHGFTSSHVHIFAKAINREPGRLDHFYDRLNNLKEIVE